jgi:hypothetical protein
MHLCSSRDRRFVWSEVSLPRRAAGAILALLTSSGAAQAESLVQLPGSFTVTPTGAAAYTIPIDVPPGTAGMKPAISLNYTSQGGNGIVGVGWTLGGLPAISRCPTTLATEGVAGAITETGIDRFCLQGQKLIAVPATPGVAIGGYGADKTVYYTEVNGFSRIVSYGKTNGGPTYFTVQTKSGQTMTFGDPSGGGSYGPSGSSPLAPNGEIRIWGLSRIADTVGNYMTVTYSTNAGVTGVTPGTNEAPYPVEIDYTLNDGTLNDGQGLTAHNSVTFSYAARSATDVIDNWTAGTESRTSGELTDIKTYAFGSLVSDYRLAYQTGTGTGRTQLVSVTRCDGAGDCQSPGVSGTTVTNPPCVADGHCLLPTTFAWQGGTVASCPSGSNCAAVMGAVMVNTGGTVANANGTFSGFKAFLGNFDGSGRSSIAWVPEDQYGRTTDGTMHFWLAQPDGTFVEDHTTNAVAAGYRVYTGDFNGDGLTDLLFDSEYQNQDPTKGAYGSYGETALWMNNGRSAWSGNGGAKFTVSNTLTVPESTGLSPMIADFDGDGRSDILWVSLDQNGKVYCGASSTYCTFWIWSGFTQNAQTGKWGYTQTWFAGGSATTGLLNSAHAYLVDITGDGRTDIAVDTEDQYGANDGSFQTWISQGASALDGTISFKPNIFPILTGVSSSAPASYQPYFGDFDGDGTTDILWVHVDNSAGNAHQITAGDGKSIIWFSNGDGNFHAVNGPNVAYSIPIVADFNGDGRADILVSQENYNSETNVGYYSTTRYTTLYLGNGDGTFSASYPRGNAPATSMTPLVADFTGDGKSDVLWSVVYANGLVQSTAQYAIWKSDGITADLVTQVSSGLGEWTQIGYAQLSGTGNVYTPGSSSAYPDIDFAGPVSVVSIVVADDGTLSAPATPPGNPSCAPYAGGSAGNGFYTSCYVYGGAVSNAFGRGFKGFGSMTVTDEETGIVQTTTYDTNLCTQGMATGSTKALAGYTLNSTANTLGCYNQSYGGLLVHFPYVSFSQAQEYELPANGGGLVKTTSTWTYYDESSPGNLSSFSGSIIDGNATSIFTWVTDSADRLFKKSTYNTYLDDPNTNGDGRWCLSRLTQSTVLSVGSAGDQVNRTSSFSYDPASCLLSGETVEPANQGSSDPGNDYLNTTYGRDGFGNINTKTVTGDGVVTTPGGGIKTRTTQTVWDTSHSSEFPLSVTLVLRHGDVDARSERDHDVCDP